MTSHPGKNRALSMDPFVAQTVRQRDRPPLDPPPKSPECYTSGSKSTSSVVGEGPGSVRQRVRRPVRQGLASPILACSRRANRGATPNYLTRTAMGVRPSGTNRGPSGTRPARKTPGPAPSGTSGTVSPKTFPNLHTTGESAPLSGGNSPGRSFSPKNLPDVPDSQKSHFFPCRTGAGQVPDGNGDRSHELASERASVAIHSRTRLRSLRKRTQALG